MGFLNNSGDIILDAVLTDTGRARLSRGDGSFKITKFALSDDEIDYSLYNSSTGSAYTDLQILQTPVLESFTNNASSMKSKLLTVNLKDILHLPSMKINDKDNRTLANAFVLNGYSIAVDKTTEDYLFSTSTTVNGVKPVGVLRGFTTSKSPIVRIDQGLDTTAVTSLPTELKETQYIIEIDNRLGTLTDKNNRPLTPSYVDDDDIASYFVSLTTDPDSVEENTVSVTDTTVSSAGQVINGPRGTIFQFGIEASLSAKTSTYLFTTLGTTYTTTRSPSTGALRTINTNILITGGTTGFSLTVPVSFVKLTT